ncbi:MAG TPA: hypothetical protein VNJ01_17215 [Bacteriovoracaceae bacterium]|nr:hypothetical protein [Bacteriovoracaceae bacterium]
MQKYIKGRLPNFKPVFKSEESKFIVWVGIKVAGISLGITLFLYYFLYLIMRLNYAFFRANGFPEMNDENPFYAYIISEVIDTLPVLFGFHVCLFFIGVYVGWLILRPFRIIGDYSERVLENINEVYRVEDFNTYKLLTRFSEFFFEYLRESRKRKEILSNSIPPQYSKIHKPVQDKIFMLHFGLLLIIIAISSAYFIIESTSFIYHSMVELATKTLSNQISTSKFFGEQMFVLDEVVNLTIIFIVLFYTMLGFHLYSKVSGAAFGIFSTMRSFMKGNHSSRVHLVGYAYLRDYTRKLNKYLDYMENTFSKESSKE